MRADGKTPAERIARLGGRLSARGERLAPGLPLPGVRRAIARYNAETDLLACGHEVPCAREAGAERRACVKCRRLACAKGAA